MPIQDLKGQIARLPEQPGVYLYSNEAGETLYVGKAKVLRDRVRSYLGAQGMSPRIDALLDEAQRLEFIVTDSVVEALALENHLIKQRGPAIQHPAARRQELPLPAADDRARPFRGCWSRAASRRTTTTTPARSCRPRSARRTMALTHRLFGIRSCNEVITGERGRPCLEYDIKRCIAPCVREICSEEDYAWRWSTRGCSSRAATTSWSRQLRERMSEAAGDERFEQAAQLRDALRTIETLQHAAAEDGRHRAWRSRRVRHQGRPGRRRRAGLPGARRQGDRADRAGLGSTGVGGAARSSERRRRQWPAFRRKTETSSRPRCSSSTPIASAPPEIHLPVALQRCRHRDDRGLADRHGGPPRPHLSSRSAARSAACSISRRATRSRLPDAVQRERRRPLRRARNAARRARPARRAAAHRVLRHLDDPGQRDRRVDGRLRRRPDEARRVPEVQDQGWGTRGSGEVGMGSGHGGDGNDLGAAVSAVPRTPHRPIPRSRESPISATTSPRCTKSCCAAIGSSSRTAGRSRT